MTRPTVLLLGPTASGKSAIAMALAGTIPLEIVSVDSALVYRGMDIGTAKPSAEERSAVPHHLIDLIEPTRSYSAAQFAQDAGRLIGEIRGRGRLPLLAGGTMLYAKALVDGLHELPAADATLRARLDVEAARLGWPALHARLARVDPASAARIEPMDAQRIQRALELFELSGEPMSALLARQTRAASGERFLTIALEPSDRSVLHERIAARFLRMLDEGFLDEVRRLRARGDLHPGMPSMRCVGYRQAWEHLDGLCDRDTMIARAVAATRQLAKRQLTWLRSMPQRQVVDCLAPDALQRVRALLQSNE
ncbi:tRNA (adenosine(37)-N6)-dimethylallyltransferase MiaA [Quisquiliibacterium transsilvanicum]|uniref:tRNA dimethylallyltransferase n=1 Tax=Quisquiliibacterium transsilvanicum TaxID=1549638 RepID=A0A7W8HGK4_9BURK|nr:tRNA (adenosine(37)-N6)-dimethylallyltransferase MiaA [Quisquiliibacterium transsilvanicum]MBB5271447.1 tRNA dimethylallyltransferase [Quisquiliibacterium transsilvanicum]